MTEKRASEEANKHRSAKESALLIGIITVGAIIGLAAMPFAQVYRGYKKFRSKFDEEYKLRSIVDATRLSLMDSIEDIMLCVPQTYDFENADLAEAAAGKHKQALRAVIDFYKSRRLYSLANEFTAELNQLT